MIKIVCQDRNVANIMLEYDAECTSNNAALARAQWSAQITRDVAVYSTADVTVWVCKSKIALFGLAHTVVIDITWLVL